MAQRKRDPVGEWKKNFLNAMQPLLEPLMAKGVRIIPESMGEAAILFDFSLGWEGCDFLLAFKMDNEGTKTIVAETMADLRPRRVEQYFEVIAHELVAANLNDLAAMGARPLAIGNGITTGDEQIFSDSRKVRGLIKEFTRLCKKYEMVIPCGETAVERGVVGEGRIHLMGAALGLVWPPEHVILRGNLRENDVILGFPSTGLQTNGYTVARAITATLPDGFLTRLPGGEILGEALLRKSKIYVDEIIALQDKGIEIHYASHVSGGGWEKIRRAPQEFTYEIVHVPQPPEIFRFLQERGNINDEEAYRVWNMGVGFVIFVPQHEVARVRTICADAGTEIIELGYVRRGPRRVQLAEKGIVI